MPSRHNGFTLIEVLITSAIISIMAAVVIVSLGGARSERQVKNAAILLSTALRDLQNNALTGKNIGADIPCDFRFGGVAVGGNSVAFQYAQRVGGSCANNPAPQALRTVTLTDGVTFGVATAGGRFTVPWGSVLDSAGADLAATLVYQVKKDVYTYSVCVYPGGRIENVSGNACP